MNIFAGLKGQAFRATARHDLTHPANWQEDYSHENGQYQCLCADCEIVFLGHKRRVACKLCAQKVPTKGIDTFRVTYTNNRPDRDVYNFFLDWAKLVKKVNSPDTLLTREQLIENLGDPELPASADRVRLIEEIKKRVPADSRLFPKTVDGLQLPDKYLAAFDIYFEYPLNKEQPK